MRNLLLLFSKFGSLILFLFLELICLILIVNFNNNQREIFLYSSNLFTGKVMERVDASVDYFNLRTLNDSIAAENARLLSQVFNAPKAEIFSEDVDSNLLQYEFIPARISNKSINMRNNRITLNKGAMFGISSGMGVISTTGILGVVDKCNKNFSSVMPVFNTQMQVSAKIKTKNYFGDLTWEPYDERFLLLKHIPKHATVTKGDTVITSGYSTIFPPDIFIGTISEIRLPAGSNYFEMKVELKDVLSNLEYVYVVDNKLKSAQKEIEEIE